MEDKVISNKKKNHDDVVAMAVIYHNLEPASPESAETKDCLNFFLAVLFEFFVYEEFQLPNKAAF